MGESQGFHSKHLLLVYIFATPTLTLAVRQDTEMELDKKTKQPRRLTNLDIREVSLVDRPAIRREFLVIKRDQDNNNNEEPDMAADDMQQELFFADSDMESDISNMVDAEVEKAMELKPATLKAIKDMYQRIDQDMHENDGSDKKMLERLAAMIAQVLHKMGHGDKEKGGHYGEEDEKDKNVEAKKSATKEEVMTESDNQESIALAKNEDGSYDLSSLPEAIREPFATLCKQNQEAVEKAAKLEELLKAEQDERLRRDFVQKAENEYTNIPGTSVEVGLLLKSLHAADAELAAKVEEIFKAVNSQLANSELLREAGSSEEPESTSAWGQIEKQAAGLVAEGLFNSKAEAVSKVLETNPRLYQEYLKEGN